MCYSARIEHDYRRYVRQFGADIDIAAFVRLYWERQEGAKVKVAKAMDAAFADAQSGPEAEIRAMAEAYNREQIATLERELFKQRKRLADAERALQTKPTKAAAESKRIATNKVEWALGKLGDLKRQTLEPQDSRIFPGWYAPVLVSEQGRRVLKPMRYQCRPEGKPAAYDRKYPGTYNARRDSLEGFWKGLFGAKHAVMVADVFYENVTGPDGKNRILEFTPRSGEPMLIACLWSPWSGDGEELLSFAAITDEPEPEVAAAGHDRTIINIKPEHLDAWLNPTGDLQALYGIFDDKRHPYYEHRFAA
jgi:putative SOS response-associated peptidase YedK